MGCIKKFRLIPEFSEFFGDLRNNDGVDLLGTVKVNKEVIS